MSDDKSAGLLSQIEALLSRVKEPAAVADDGKGPVAYSRFFEANQNLKAAREGLTALQSEVAELKTSHAARLKEIQEEAGKSVSAVHNRYQENDALRGLGLDADGADEVRRQYGKLPEAGRPESPVAFWQSNLEAVAAHRADPEKVAAPQLPKTLTPYVPQPDAPAEPSAPSSAGGRQKGGGVVLRQNVDQGVVRGERKTQAQKVAAAVASGDQAAFWGAIKGA